MKGANKKLGEILIQEEVLTQAQLEQALAEQEEAGGFLGAILVRLGFIDEEELTNFLVKQCRIPYLKLSGFTLNEKISSLIPPAICRRYQILPMDKLGNLLTVAMVNPLDVEALEAIKKCVPYRIKPIICSWHDYERIFEDFYGSLTAAEEAEAAAPAAVPAAAPPPTPVADATAVAKAAEASQAAPAALVPPAAPNLIADYTFENFLVAEANTFTVAVAKEVSQSPGGEHNPFFLYGEPGLGKTHLANAIGHAMLARDAGPVCYISAGRFSDELLEAITVGVVDRFRAKYQQVGLLILDDVQLFAGRDRLQEEFFHLFNLLLQRRQQIVVISDVPPNQLQHLEQRLISRFAGGMVATVEAPDEGTRLAILQQQLQGVGGEIPEPVLAMLAREIPTNVRELQGALKKLLAYAALVEHEITEELAQQILKHLFTQAAAQ